MRKKSFWKTSGYSFTDILNLDNEKLLLLLNAFTTDDIREWLQWNDPNGIYDNHQSLKELGRVLTREEGIEIMLRQIEENRIT